MVGAFTSSEELILLGRVLFQLHDRHDSWTDGAMKRFSEKYYFLHRNMSLEQFCIRLQTSVNVVPNQIYSVVHLREYARYQSQLHTRDERPRVYCRCYR